MEARTKVKMVSTVQTTGYQLTEKRQEKNC